MGSKTYTLIKHTITPPTNMCMSWPELGVLKDIRCLRQPISGFRRAGFKTCTLMKHTITPPTCMSGPELRVLKDIRFPRQPISEKLRCASRPEFPEHKDGFEVCLAMDACYTGKLRCNECFGSILI